MSDRAECSAEGCPNSIANNAWARRRASDWFFMRDGTQWCPAHVPEWVAAWRGKKKTR